MMKKRQDSPAMLNRVTMKSSTKMDLEAKEDWLEKMALKLKSYQLNEAREAESILVKSDLQEEEVWLDKMVHMLGLHQDNGMVKRILPDKTEGGIRNCQHDQVWLMMAGRGNIYFLKNGRLRERWRTLYRTQVRLMMAGRGK